MRNKIHKCNIKILYVFIGLMLILIITGCSKKGPVESTEDLVETEQTEESTEDEFAINNGNTNLPGYEVRETRKSREEEESEEAAERESAIEQFQEEYKEENREILESEAAEKAEREVVDSGLTIDVTELEDDYYSTLVSNIKTQSYNSIDDVYIEVDTKYSAYNDEIREKLKRLLKETWDFWEERYAEIETQERPWTEEELAENPDLASYTREEVEEINRKAEELGIIYFD